eukprot:CAMPEP_0117003322 /NCGR_PEP_ID=MMETSP0472-20121206/4680_1 /TAXON_ID=693140 ORGANISM="Tiarina fusus, Strain LIS" /NCGR_SAMPLE_ID=MMETSP0472 /ASSEMBLY_ACC=CAM_ASM_000603 /LENGTH=1783 /DNA_ID=CAMNT_0004703931 /DNA_START=212 /DNA_END=5560 /DNA_ORIENTATION=+
MAQSSSNSSNGQNGNRGWFEGTMEVISGMAPRPSTPQPYNHQSAAPRSMSAPNSPARPFNFPGINRLPSQDSLDRSIHNESGHGKSTAQIIRDLKSANASLSAKSASMEANLNQMASVTKKMEDKQRTSDEQLRQYKKQLAHLEAYKAASDSKLREKDAQLSKVKEESAFQRHSISDLKNQLYQLQTEMEDQEMEKRDDFEQILADNQEMARQLAVLQQKCNDYEQAMASKEQDQYYRRQLKESQGELETHRKRLSVSQVSLREVQQEKESLEEEHAQRVQKLEFELEDRTEQWRARERDLQQRIDSMEFTDSQLAQDLRQQLEERDETILELQAKMDQYADKAAELATALAQAREDAENQEQYRRDEAEDLRILHDAQEEEITKLRKDLDDARNELELRDSELDEKDRELKQTVPSKDEVANLKRQLSDATLHSNAIEKLEKELAEAREGLTLKEKEVQRLQRQQPQQPEGRDEDPGMTGEMAEKLAVANENAARLERELAELRKEQDDRMSALKSKIDKLQSEKDQVTKKLEELQKEKDAAVSNLEETNTEFSKLKNHWEQKSGAALEVDRLRKELEVTKEHLQESVDVEKAALETMKEKLQESATVEQAALAKTEELERKLKEMEHLQRDQDANADEVERLQRSLDQMKSSTQENPAALEDARKEIEELHAMLQAWENGENSNRLTKQLREAQVALVALDDEKKDASTKHRELLSAVERKKEEIQRDSREQLAAKQKELDALKKKVRQLEEVEASKKTLSSQLDQAKIRSRALESELQKAKIKSRNLESEVERAKSEASSLQSVSRSTPSVTSETFESEKQSLENQIEKLEGEKDALRTKLKDRDTTIAALVRSSMKLEQKISAMETELSSAKSVQSTENNKSDVELADLRNAVSALKEKEPQLNEDIAILKREVKLAKSDAKRFRKALQEDGTTGSEYRFQIAMLQKELEETVIKVEERDIAIENLVNQSISQDAHVKDLKTRLSTFLKEGEKKNKFEDTNLKAEIRRLQQESEIFAGQIIEQDDELEKLKAGLQTRDDQISALKKQVSHLQSRSSLISASRSFDEDENVKRELSKAKSDLRARESDPREAQIEGLQKQLERSRNGSNSDENQSRKVMDMQAELDELREASEENRKELRDLRRKLWDAKEAAGEASDLKLELAQAKYALEEYKRTNADKLSSQSRAAPPAADSEELKQLQNEHKQLKQDLDQALDGKKMLEQRIAQQSDKLRRQMLSAQPKAADPQQVKSLQTKIDNLQRDLDEARDSKKSLTLQAEELRRQKIESADRLRTEIKSRDARISELQKSTSNMDEAHVSIFQKEIETLRKELGEKTDTLDKLQNSLNETESALYRSESLKLKLVGELADTKAAYKILEQESAEREEAGPSSDETIELKSKNEALAAQNEELATAHRALSTAIEDMSRKLENKIGEIEKLTAQNEELAQTHQGLSTEANDLSNALERKIAEIERLKAELNNVSKEQNGAEDLRRKLEQANEAREQAEQDISDSYESKLASLTRDKNKELESLRQEMEESRGQVTQDITGLVGHVKELESENSGLREQFEIELQAKNQQIYALEHTLHAQEQTVESMREEMDQLQSGMNHATERRRGEVEDLQQEVMQIEARAMKQEREVVALKMQLEESKLEHKAEVVRLKDVILNMEKESPLARTVAELQNDDRMLEVRERLEQLKMRNTSLQEENLKLGGRLERSIIEIKSFEAEKKHAADMERENSSLRRQVQGLEQLLQRPPVPSRTPADKENTNARAPSTASSPSSS